MIPRRGKKPITDITGKTYGRLVVESFAGHVKGRPAWNCRCACGKPAVVTGALLKNGHTSSCGCFRLERLRDALSVIVPGKQYGRLTAIEATDQSLGGSVLWLCKCECGRPARVTAKRLQSGNTGSCGCRKKEAGLENIEARKVDLVGRKYGLLVVTAREATTRRTSYWKCECRCGREKVVPHGSLTSGRTISCGCKEGGPGVTALMPLEERQKAAVRGHARRARKRAAGGRFTAGDIDRIFKAQRGRCAYCRAKPARDEIHRDHIHPLARGGSNHARNVQIACDDCNRKGSKDPLDFARAMGLLL